MQAIALLCLHHKTAPTFAWWFQLVGNILCCWVVVLALQPDAQVHTLGQNYMPMQGLGLHAEADEWGERRGGTALRSLV